MYGFIPRTEALVGQLGLAIELMPRPGVGEGLYIYVCIYV